MNRRICQETFRKSLHETWTADSRGGITHPMSLREICLHDQTPQQRPVPEAPMSHRFKLSSLLAVAAALPTAVPVAVSIQPARAATATTAWQNGSFALNASGVEYQSDIGTRQAKPGCRQSP